MRRDTTGAYIQGDSPFAITGGDPSIPLPFQSALVVSLRSSFDGPTGRGRFYLPVPAVTVSSLDGLITDAKRTAAQTQALEFLRGCNTDLGAFSPGLKVAVISGGSVGKALPPEIHTVTKVGVGKVVDTRVVGAFC